jgi:Protein of unknown function DUF262
MGYKSHSLFRLLEDIEANRLLLPHIQRPFVWQREQMAKLFDSLMRNYPIQTLLFWRTREAIRARKFMPFIEADVDLSKFYDKGKSAEGVEKIFVLDGQQRLQTLHCIFRGGVLEEGDKVAETYFDVTAGATPVEDGECLYALKFSSDSLPLPFFRIRDLSEKFARRNASDVADEIHDILPDEPSSEEGKRRERRVRNNILQLDALLHTDKFFWADELDGVAGEFPYRRILEIFVRVNSGGTKLSRSDLMFSAMKEGWEDIEERVEQTVDLLNLDSRLTIDGELILKALMLVHGDGPEVGPEKFQGAVGEALLAKMDEHWDSAEQAFRELRDFMVHTLRLSSDRLIRSYNALIVLFDFLYHNPKPGEIDRASMAAFFHKAQLFGWFSSQTDTTLRVLHGLVGTIQSRGFPLADVKRYFRESRFAQTEITENTLDDARTRPLLLNVVYFDKWGASPFDVASKGNEPHVDHIYPQHMLRTRLGCRSADINDIGNLRFFGATDNIRKRAELPASYFARLRAHGVPIDLHLLVEEFSANPSNLAFDRTTYDRFRHERRAAIWKSLKRVVDPELESQTTTTATTRGGTNNG